MNQATAMKLQQEVKGREQELEQAYVRMERGEAPNDDAEREWNRMVRDELRRAQDVHETKEVRGTETEGGGGRRTGGEGVEGLAEGNRMVRDELRRAQDVHEKKEVRGAEAEE